MDLGYYLPGKGYEEWHVYNKIDIVTMCPCVQSKQSQGEKYAGIFPPRHACEPNCLNQWRHWVKLIKLWSIHVWVAGKQFPKCGDRLFVSILFLGPIQKEQQEQRSSKYVNDSPVIYQMVNYDLFNYKFLRVSHLTRLRLLSHQVYFPQPLLAV